VLGAETHVLGDGIRRAFEARVSKPPQYGYSQDALIGRRQILQAAYDTLFDSSSREDYNRSIVEDSDSTITTYVPWDKVPGALCVLQEAGETELVLQVGKSLLLERLPKAFKQDVVLAMVLAYVDLSRDAMALNPPDFVSCCEVLERGLKLLQTILTPLGTLSEYAAKADCEIPFALERGLCSLLLGDVDKCRMWLGIESDNSPYRDPAIVEFVMDNSDVDKDNDVLPGLCKLLETWLREVVFPRCRDTHDIYFKLGDYYDDPMVLKYLERMEGDHGSPLAAAAAIVKIGAEEATAALGSVKSSVLQALQKVFPLTNKEERLSSEEYRDGTDIVPGLHTQETVVKNDQDKSGPHVEVSKKSDPEDSNEQDLTNEIKNAVMKIMSAGMVVGLLTLVGIKCLPGRNSLPVMGKETGSAIAANFTNIGNDTDSYINF
ncbi:hypothetical protein B296_00029304, partial [Ensete ventricosum]